MKLRYTQLQFPTVLVELLNNPKNVRLRLPWWNEGTYLKLSVTNGPLVQTRTVEWDCTKQNGCAFLNGRELGSDMWEIWGTENE